MRTSELTDTALDRAVAKALGLNEEDYVEIDNLYGPVWRGPEYSTDWAQGGPIIEREEIELTRGTENSNGWTATIDLYEGDAMRESCTGPTPLIAAMRCFVASCLGEEVDIPEELK